MNAVTVESHWLSLKMQFSVVQQSLRDWNNETIKLYTKSYTEKKLRKVDIAGQRRRDVGDWGAWRGNQKNCYKFSTWGENRHDINIKKTPNDFGFYCWKLEMIYNFLSFHKTNDIVAFSNSSGNIEKMWVSEWGWHKIINPINLIFLITFFFAAITLVKEK